MDEEKTHLIFDNKKIIISPSLWPVFDFLQKIDKEVESMLGFELKLEKIRIQYLEMLDLVGVMSKTIQDNKLDFEFTFSENPEKITENLSHYYITRAEMIVLFANLDTLLCLYTAYEFNINNENEIRTKIMDSKYVKSFLNEFILNTSNLYYKKNETRFKKINAKQIRDLRNKLTHFFSVQGLNLIPNKLEKEARVLEQKIGHSISFISPFDFYKLIKNASLLLVVRWSNDFNDKRNKFDSSIDHVKKIVESDAPRMVELKDLKF